MTDPEDHLGELAALAGEAKFWETPQLTAFMPGYTLRSLPRRLTLEELKGAQDRKFNAAKKKLKREGRLLGAMHLFAWHDGFGAGGELVLPTNEYMESGAMKDLLSARMRRIAAGLGCYAIMHVTEAWRTEGDATDEVLARQKAGEDFEIKDHPARKEVLLVTLEVRGLCRTLCAELIRGRSGAFRTLRDNAIAEDKLGEFEGRFMTLIQDNGAS